MTQIYLPNSNFTLVAKCLDSKRLNKQITEAKQVYTANHYGYGKQGNPAPYDMWKGHDEFLGCYVVELYKEWQKRLVNGSRGGSMYHKAGEFILLEVLEDRLDLSNPEKPNWINDERIYSSYRSALLYKDYEWYSQFGWSEKPATPVKIDKKGNVTLPYVYGIGS
jgi:hypothetical protein